MDITNEFNKLIEERKIYQGDIDYARNPTIQAMIELFTQDTDNTVRFLMEDCNGEQLIWLSEILDEIIEATKSRRIIDACFHVVEKYPEVAKKYNIKFFINSAMEYLE